MTGHMTHEEFIAAAKARVCALAKSIIASEIPVLDGAHEMFTLLPQAGLSTDDEIYREFVLIHSETEHLPIGKQVSSWPPGSLERLQPEFDSAAAWARPITLAACKSLLIRFGA